MSDLMGYPNWPALNRRRGHLIQRKIAGEATEAELAELQHLQEAADEHLAEVAPRPVEVLNRLERQLRELDAVKAEILPDETADGGEGENMTQSAGVFGYRETAPQVVPTSEGDLRISGYIHSLAPDNCVAHLLFPPGTQGMKGGAWIGVSEARKLRDILSQWLVATGEAEGE